MIDRHKTKPGRSGEQGAALVVAIAIMTILLAVALTFYAVSRQEVTNAINVRNQVQVDLLLDASLAMAQVELNRDFLNNPSATSNDSAAFSLFNGSAWVGKQWALRYDPIQGRNVPLQEGGVPLVNMTDMPLVQFNPVNPADDTYVEPLYSGPLSRDWLYYPRFENDENYLYGAPQFTDGVASIDYLDRITLAPFTNYRNGEPFNPALFDLTSTARPPFVTPAFYGPGFGDADNDGTFGLEGEAYPLEWIHTWTDVDGDGDGLNDAIWIPLPQDRFFSGGEFREELGAYQYDDGIDNDLDAAPHLLPDGITTEFYDERPEASEGEIELGTFVYNGRADGLDNDGDGAVDEADENNLFLTTPLTDLRVYLDFNADGLVPDFVPDSTGVMQPLVLEVLAGNVTVQTNGGPVTLTNLDVDVLDNDYDMLVNDYQLYAYVGPNPDLGAPFMLRGFEDTGVSDGAGGTIVRAIENAGADNTDPSAFGVAERKSYERLNIDVALGNSPDDPSLPPDPSDRNTFLQIFPNTGTFYSDSTGAGSTYDYEDLLPHIILTHSGEPVCELAGRAAITIRDEASKINMNVAGGHNFDPTLVPSLVPGDAPAFRSLGDGATTAEIETRNLPGVGPVRAQNLWTQRTGMPDNGVVDPFYAMDAVFPGFGRVDDNANVLVSSLNRRDDDGDGLVDEGIYLPEISDLGQRYLNGTLLATDDPVAAEDELIRTRYVEYYEQLGAFEGVDEPGELQRYNPLPNLQAEGRNPHKVSITPLDFLDNDDDGAINELGELGDLQLQDTLKMVTAGNPNFADPNLASPGNRYKRIEEMVTNFSTDRNSNFVAGLEGIRAVNKLDYNFATPVQLAANLILSNPFAPVTSRFTPGTEASFAEGLRQSDVHIRASGGLLNNTVTYFAADPVLQAMQAAVDIVDNRDSDHSRSVLTSERMKATLPAIPGYDYFPERLGVRERIADGAYFPLGELQDHLQSAMSINRKLEIRDDWWTFEAGVTGVNGNDEVRHISYTASGHEAIKINEVMVRAVRRIEAEAVTGTLLTDDPMNDPAIVPLTNFDPTPFDVGGASSVLPQFNVSREAEAGWVLNNGGFLGDTSQLGISNSDDILEFTINASAGLALGVQDGLPPGRYYLTVNTTYTDGTTDVVPTTELPPALAAAGPILEVAVKYRHRTAGGQLQNSILQDFNAPFPDNIDPFQPVPDEHVGGFIPGAPSGWAFLRGTLLDPTLNNANYFLDGLPDDPPGPPPVTFPSTQPVANVETFTVTVPHVGSSYELRIALRMNPDFVAALTVAGLPYSIAINSLDFSQEPDHEWLELVNVSDETVNIGGWEMEVGIPDRPSVPSDPFKSRWRIPPGTEIAGRGMVLLAVNKFDSFKEAPAAQHIAENGMGLADGDPIVGMGNLLTNLLTVPPIVDNSPGTAYPNIFDATGSVFKRLNSTVSGFTDYLDTDGDGRSALRSGAAADNIARESALASSKELGTLLTSANGNFPWDRIIQLEESSILTSDNPFTASPSAKRLLDVTTVDDVAALVLRGGVFPNYPELDGHDNDGDGGYVQMIDLNGDTILEPAYFAGTLDRDMIDNNLNNYVDERGTAHYNDGIDQFDNYGALDTSLGDGVNPLLSEGVDEGRGVNAGEYRPGIIGALFFNSRQLGVYPADDPTANPFNYFDFNALSPPSYLEFTPSGATGIAVGPASLADTDGRVAAVTPNYMGSDADPADWKAFLERRWYPGDNVIITLYEGPALNGQVVDRVTYTQYDVINRTIDDVVTVPYTAVDVNGSGSIELIERPYLNFDPVTLIGYPSMWLPNQMGLDFYRSLERKHPLYNGDRFGTENRWQATDGNYDDWSESISFFEDELATATVPAGTVPLRIAAGRAGNIRPRFLDAHPLFPGPNPNALANRQMFAHGIWGSPLRLNTVMRRGENPPDLEKIENGTFADTRQFPGSFDYFRTHEMNDFAVNPVPSLPDQRWNLAKAFVANRPYQSPGDLMRVPHQVYIHDAINTSGPAGVGYLRDMTSINYGLRGDLPVNDLRSYAQDIALRGATLGQDTADEQFSPNILTAAIGSMALESTVLTMGQAEFHPILPAQADVVANLDLLRWVQNAGSSNPDDLLAPAAWMPVFLFGLPRDGSALIRDEQFPHYPPYANGERVPPATTFDTHFLFNTNYLFNPNNFGGVDAFDNDLEDRWPLETRTALYVSENRGPRAPEALFTWDGADGLENGEYVVYIGTFLPNMREDLEEAAKHSARVVDNATAGIDAKDNPALLYINADGSQNTVMTLDDGTTIPEIDRVTKSILSRDPTNPRATGQVFNPVYAIDIITNPTEARGQAPEVGVDPIFDPSAKPAGLIHPNNWNPTVQYRAGTDGYIFYGNNAAGGWKPQIVQVTDNFLALRVRNLGTQGQVGALTHIVLAPRKRTAGRINVNTTQSRVTESGNQEYFSSLLGLPGVVDVARTVLPAGATVTTAPIQYNDALGLMGSAPNGALPLRWNSPVELYGGAPLLTPPDRYRFDIDVPASPNLLVPNSVTGVLPRHTVGAFRLNAMLLGGRTEHIDGRYYESVGALVQDTSAFDFDQTPFARADMPALGGGFTDGVEDFAIYPLSNEALAARRFDEVQARFSRLGNLVTTRSDVFEIIMTVEAGYGVDANGDGFFNYRDPSEFVTTAATKATAVYERRAPSDTSGISE